MLTSVPLPRGFRRGTLLLDSRDRYSAEFLTATFDSLSSKIVEFLTNSNQPTDQQEDARTRMVAVAGTVNSLQNLAGDDLAAAHLRSLPG